MRIKYIENSLLQDDEIEIIYHPNNLTVAHEIASYLNRTLNVIRCYDDKERRFIEIPLLSIYYIEIIDHRIYAYTLNQELRVCYQKLSDVKQHDVFSYFRQTSVTTLVNIHHIVGIRLLIGAKRELLLDNGEMIIVTRTFKKNFEDFVVKFK